MCPELAMIMTSTAAPGRNQWRRPAELIQPTAYHFPLLVFDQARRDCNHNYMNTPQADPGPADDAAGTDSDTSAGNQRKRARFAYAIRANETHHASRWDVESDMVQSDSLSVMQADVPDTCYVRLWRRLSCIA